jgi:hypothetical protein
LGRLLLAMKKPQLVRLGLPWESRSAAAGV